MYLLSGLYVRMYMSIKSSMSMYVSDVEELAAYNYAALNATVSIVLKCFSFITGVPKIVPNIVINDNTTINKGNNVTLTLSWGEPFNNLDPIVNYIVSCSGDVTCPSNFTTTDNTTRSYTVTNLTTMTTYTFSVVATNSIGSGEAGVVMITTPGEGV